MTIRIKGQTERVERAFARVLAAWRDWQPGTYEDAAEALRTIGDAICDEGFSDGHFLSADGELLADNAKQATPEAP